MPSIIRRKREREVCGSGFTAIYAKPGNPGSHKDEEEDVEMKEKSRARQVRYNYFFCHIKLLHIKFLCADERQFLP